MLIAGSLDLPKRRLLPSSRLPRGYCLRLQLRWPINPCMRLLSAASDVGRTSRCNAIREAFRYHTEHTATPTGEKPLPFWSARMSFSRERSLSTISIRPGASVFEQSRSIENGRAIFLFLSTWKTHIYIYSLFFMQKTRCTLDASGLRPPRRLVADVPAQSFPTGTNRRDPPGARVFCCQWHSLIQGPAVTRQHPQHDQPPPLRGACCCRRRRTLVHLRIKIRVRRLLGSGATFQVCINGCL